MNPQRYERLLREVDAAKFRRQRAENNLLKRIRKMTSKQKISKPEEISFMMRTARSFFGGEKVYMKEDVEAQANSDDEDRIKALEMK